jgi:hypothetical protein
MKIIKLTSLSLLLFATQTFANTPKPDRALKTNYELIYNTLPSSTDNFLGLFSEGKIYSRLRSNTFLYEWEAETAEQESHLVSGLGGSLIFKSANFYDIGFTTGLYYTYGFTNAATDEFIKSGKDIYSRYDATNGGGNSLAVIGEAFVEYQGLSDTNIRAGRQIVSSFYVKPNDSKMLPNTFDGLVIRNKSFEKTELMFAYLASQKLRDHSTGHSVIAVADDTPVNNKYSQNDDTARHQGLTVAALTAARVDVNTPLYLGQANRQPLEDLKMEFATYVLPDLVSQGKVEAHYKVVKKDGYTLTTSVRYIRQFDHGAGAIGGASIDGDVNNARAGGYSDPDSLDSQMVAARMVTKYKNYLVNIGYSQVFDEADLVAPWRGFPTGGYTRSMARFNWEANTKSYRVLLKVNPNKKAVFDKTYIETSILHTDADELKGEFDENYYYLGFVQNVPSFQDLQWRFRFGYADTQKPDADNIDSRFEVNYLF